MDNDEKASERFSAEPAAQPAPGPPSERAETTSNTLTGSRTSADAPTLNGDAAKVVAPAPQSNPYAEQVQKVINSDVRSHCVRRVISVLNI